MSKFSDPGAPHTLVKRDSTSGRVLATVKKDIQDAADLYFRPFKVLAKEFTRALETHPKGDNRPVYRKK